MSGVIDENGVQWEHCNLCTKFVEINNLGYLPPNPKHPHGADICISCTNKLLDDDLLETIVPSKLWLPQYEGEVA